MSVPDRLSELREIARRRRNRCRPRPAAPTASTPAGQSPAAQVPHTPGQTVAQTSRDRITRGLWYEMHTAALSPAGLAQAKLNDILGRMPCGACAADFLAIRKADPLPADIAQHFAATVRWHNAVNLKLGKPEMSVDDACKLYAQPPTTAA